MRVEPRPKATPEILRSQAAAEKHQNAKDAWGERGWATVGRLCRFFDAQGMVLPFECPAAPEESRADPAGE